ncbi:hypothetical protein [Nocardia macrotermitis]|nr:hypothetical protein [Nocardia macrotermitis]
MTSSGQSDVDRAIGVLIAESLRVGSTLPSLGITLGTITRLVPAQPAAGQPPAWTLIEFGVDVTHAHTFADELAGALDIGPWYVEFHTHTETFIVFRNRIFRFARDDEHGHTIAADHGRNLGIPDHQLDWPR